MVTQPFLMVGRLAAGDDQDLGTDDSTPPRMLEDSRRWKKSTRTIW
jgi:hypothetical protein